MRGFKPVRLSLNNYERSWFWTTWKVSYKKATSGDMFVLALKGTDFCCAVWLKQHIRVVCSSHRERNPPISDLWRARTEECVPCAWQDWVAPHVSNSKWCIR